MTFDIIRWHFIANISIVLLLLLLLSLMPYAIAVSSVSIHWVICGICHNIATNKFSKRLIMFLIIVKCPWALETCFINKKYYYYFIIVINWALHVSRVFLHECIFEENRVSSERLWCHLNITSDKVMFERITLISAVTVVTAISAATTAPPAGWELICICTFMGNTGVCQRT